MPITAEIKLTRGDYARFQRASSRRLVAQPGARVTSGLSKLAIWLLMFAAMFIAFKAAATHPTDAPSFYLLTGLVGAAVLLTRAQPHLVAGRLRKMIVLDTGSFLRPHKLEFTSGSVIATWLTGRSEHQWCEILSHSVDEANHYLFVDGCAALVVPRVVVAPFKADFDRYVAAIPPA